MQFILCQGHWIVYWFLAPHLLFSLLCMIKTRWLQRAFPRLLHQLSFSEVLRVAFLVVQMVKNLPAMLKTQIQSLGQKDPLEKRMVTHSSILAWRIHGQRNLAGYSPWGHKESDMTKQITLSHFHFVSGCIDQRIDGKRKGDSICFWLQQEHTSHIWEIKEAENIWSRERVCGEEVWKDFRQLLFR